MKKILLVLIMLMSTYGVYAQAEQEKLSPMTGITLTKEQRTKINILNKGVVAEIKALKDNSALKNRDRFLKIKEVRGRQGAAMKKILTSEQYAQWQKNTERIRNQNQK